LRARSIHSTEYKLLAKRLKELREKNGVKQAEVSQRLGRPHSFPNKVETAQRGLDPIELMDYVEALGGDYLSFISDFTLEIKALRNEDKI
jgi:transcriptional regulator with XRE-family HTH domain